MVNLSNFKKTHEFISDLIFNKDSYINDFSGDIKTLMLYLYNHLYHLESTFDNYHDDKISIELYMYFKVSELIIDNFNVDFVLSNDEIYKMKTNQKYYDEGYIICLDNDNNGFTLKQFFNHFHCES
jgi:hypothetical protein